GGGGAGGWVVTNMNFMEAPPPLDEFKLIPSTYYGPIKGMHQRSLKMDWSALDGLDEIEGIEHILAEAKAQGVIPAGIGDTEARRHFRYLRNWAYNLNTYDTSMSSLNLDVYISRVSESPEEQGQYADMMRDIR